MDNDGDENITEALPRNVLKEKIVRFSIRKERTFRKSENKLHFFLLRTKARRVGGGVYGGC